MLFSGLGAWDWIVRTSRANRASPTMAESHDWVTPRLWGAPGLRAGLYYWQPGSPCAFLARGEFAARLPVGDGALLAVLAVAWTRCVPTALALLGIPWLMLPTRSQ